MNYTILTESEFFDRINAPKNSDMQLAYDKFVEKIIQLCENPTKIHRVYRLNLYRNGVGTLFAICVPQRGNSPVCSQSSVLFP